jgi:chemotaxis protein CheX
MMNQESIVGAVRSATEEVFSVMLGMTAVSGEPYTETNAPGPSNGIIGLIGLAGAWVGTASVCCGSSMGCRIATQMLGADYTEFSEDVLDAVSEITNMIIGGFKTTAEIHLGPLGLSIPTVIFGLTFSARSAGKEQWTVVPFTCEGDLFEVKICLTPNRGLPHLAVSGSAHTVKH